MPPTTLPRLRTQAIRCRHNRVHGMDHFRIGGWLSGKDTYLWFGDDALGCFGTLDKARLYRLAKAIVRHMETDK